jgi:hypothetical protein
MLDAILLHNDLFLTNKITRFVKVTSESETGFQDSICGVNIVAVVAVSLLL